MKNEPTTIKFKPLVVEKTTFGTPVVVWLPGRGCVKYADYLAESEHGKNS